MHCLKKNWKKIDSKFLFLLVSLKQYVSKYVNRFELHLEINVF